MLVLVPFVMAVVTEDNLAAGKGVKVTRSRHSLLWPALLIVLVGRESREAQADR